MCGFAAAVAVPGPDEANQRQRCTVAPFLHRRRAVPAGTTQLTTWYCVVLLLYCIVLYCIVLICIVVYYIVLYCIVLYCILILVYYIVL